MYSAMISETTIDCENNKNGTCLIASRLAERNARITQGACEYCIKQDHPKDENCVTASLAIYSWKDNELKRKEKLRELYYLTSYDSQRKQGPGDKLIYILGKLRISHKEGCGCEEHAKKMNQMGSEVCRREVYLIVGWMKEASIQRNWNWLFNEELAKFIVYFACDLSDGKGWFSIFPNLINMIRHYGNKVDIKVEVITR